MQELFYDRAAHPLRLDHLEHLLGSGSKTFRTRRQIHVRQILGQAAMVVYVTLGNRAAVEPFGDDGIGHAEPKQLSILKMAQRVRVQAMSPVFLCRAVSGKNV